MRWKPVSILILTSIASSVLLCGCAVWHKIASPPPQYVVYPTLSMAERMKEPPAKFDANRAADFNTWRDGYKEAIGGSKPWFPDADLIKETLPNVGREFGKSESDSSVVRLSAMAKEFLFETNSSRDLFGGGNATAALNNKVANMFRLTDHEQANLFITNWAKLSGPGRFEESHFLSTHIPNLTSPNLPVGVSVTPTFGGASGQGDSKSDAKDEKKVVFDKVMLTIEAASSTNSKPAGAEKTASKIPDFDSQQKVTLHLSTVLNSPSVLDRIEYVSTYVYIYPWQNVPNGHVVLEREFWRYFFAVNEARDSLISGRMATNDMRRAIDDMRVRLRDVSTTVQYFAVDLGSLQHTAADSSELNLTGKLSELAPPTLPSLDATGKVSSSLTSVANIQLKQQLDQRSTYIDSHGDFLRITQRGMQSVNLAGRVKEEVTLSIPPSLEQFRVLIPKAKDDPAPGDNKNSNGGSSAPGGGDNQQKKSEPKVFEFEIALVSEPLYSRVEAITFSVVVARQATHLLHSSRDRYSLDDPRDAAFIADVTRPQRVILWQWDRLIDELQTWDLFGQKGTEPQKEVYFVNFLGERPSPAYLMNFKPADRDKLIKQIRDKWIENNISGKGGDPVQVNDVHFGLVDKTEPMKLKPFAAPNDKVR